MNKLTERHKTYNTISSSLACMSNKQLEQMLADGKAMHTGIGGTSLQIKIDNTAVFVKKVPLTDLELLPENYMSTANIFNLPMCYQYGIGSAGFGAWRELAAHVMTTNWVITGQCPNFPIMYHWRILPHEPFKLNIDAWGTIKKYYHYWENSNSIRKRVESLNKASAHIALFLEYIPQNLYEWLPGQIAQGRETSELAISFVDKNLKTTNTYMNTNGLMHFDAHFENILTDGNLLYFSDFGLALSRDFELTQTETKFLNRHQCYDESYANLNLLRAIFQKDSWDIRLSECSIDQDDALTPKIVSKIKQYMPVALLMDEFLEKLRKENKSTPFPSTDLMHLLYKNKQVKS